ncbi:MAG TPA: His/Gly/Thr/Pro-type tRNA ligase C-terminal domain-containing protein, partial [Candidatus Polarisedimenticolia bacterium]|nr:His/Gly/Thr/Pro-type tRNA ligase C-terminal domain-containing protein [Candidatus Polarisedimenticolia bacterium]
MALPVVKGLKSEQEKFAGALRTYCIEALMQDGKALQAGTSHNLGQNFSRAFDVKFQSQDGKMEHVWQTSWGVSTRLVGALVLAHGDDQGLVLPPALAPIQAVIVPIGKTDEEKAAVRAAVDKLCHAVSGKVRIHADLREEVSPGFKFNEWELKGVPLRLEIGPRDLAQGKLVCVSRLDRKKESLPLDGIEARLPGLLAGIQRSLYERALKFRIDNTRPAKSYAEFKEQLETLGGFFEAFWCGSAECEKKIKEETKATIRCIPLEGQGAEGTCLYCGTLSRTRVLMARAY